MSLETQATRPLHSEDMPSVTGASGPLAAASMSGLRAGQSFGRYIVLEDLAQGGMSIVFVAYDPKLDRRVALKVMRPDAHEAPHRAQARLLREGQAMARLAHPNVVRVYDVGVIGERVYMAMELVEGLTLRDWLRARPRPWREQVDMLVRAGRGLAAAHDAGMVHLDIKPRNILVGTDGEVRVVDFGLARTPRSPESMVGDSMVSDDGFGHAPFDEEVTHAGLVMGTPGYMAPEQLRSIKPDARSDQFAFCVTAWEALHGVRPFRGLGAEDYRVAIELGSPAAPPSEPKVPLRLRRILERGLSIDPDQRFASMSELLDAMTDDPWRRWRGRGLVAVAVGGMALGAWALGRGNDEACQGIESQLDGVWDEERRDAVRDRLAEGGGEHAMRTADEVALLLDGYAQRWTAQAVDACVATHVDHRQSEALLDLRDYCLQHRLRALRATTDLIIESPPSTAIRWRDAVIGLPTVSRCSDLTSVHHVGQPPEDPAVRRAVEELSEEIARANALVYSGNSAAAVEAARPLIKRAESTAHMPTIAEAKVTLAEALLQFDDAKGAERWGYEGNWAADLAGMYELRLEAYVDLVFAVGVMQGRFDEAINLGRGGLLLERQRVDSPVLRAQLLSNLGSVYATAGRTELAKEHFEEALAVRREAELPEDLNEGTTLVGLGAIELLHGEYAAALVLLERSRSMMRDHYGSGHPATLVAQENVAIALDGLDRFEEAREMAAEAIEIATAKGQNERQLASVRTTLGSIEIDLGRFDEAREQLEIARRVLEAESLQPLLLGVVHGNLAEVALQQQRPEDAKRESIRGGELLVELLGSEHLYVAWVLGLQARAEMELGVPLVALEHASKAMSVLQGADDPRGSSMRSDAALVLARALDDPEVRADPEARARFGGDRSVEEWAKMARREAEAGGRAAESTLARALAWRPRESSAP